MVGPTFTLAKTGNVVQASTSLSSSYAANKIKDTYIGDLSVEKICPTVHSAEINQSHDPGKFLTMIVENHLK